MSSVSVRPAKESWKRLRMTIDSSGVADVVLDRPPANAIDLVTLAEINEVAEALSMNKSVRVVMLRSALMIEMIKAPMTTLTTMIVAGPTAPISRSRPMPSLCS